VLPAQDTGHKGFDEKATSRGGKGIWNISQSLLAAGIDCLSLTGLLVTIQQNWCGVWSIFGH
jgi:hypothetical protein